LGDIEYEDESSLSGSRLVDTIELLVAGPRTVEELRSLTGLSTRQVEYIVDWLGSEGMATRVPGSDSYFWTGGLQE